MEAAFCKAERVTFAGSRMPAAIMSIAAANTFTRNIYREGIKPNATQKQEAQVSKIASLVVKAFALAFVLGMDKQNAINLQLDRVNYWLNVGAQPTDTVRALLRRAGVLKERHEARLEAKGVTVKKVAAANATANSSSKSDDLTPPPGPVVMLADDADRAES